MTLPKSVGSLSDGVNHAVMTLFEEAPKPIIKQAVS